MKKVLFQYFQSLTDRSGAILCQTEDLPVIALQPAASQGNICLALRGWCTYLKKTGNLTQAHRLFLAHGNQQQKLCQRKPIGIVVQRAVKCPIQRISNNVHFVQVCITESGEFHAHVNMLTLRISHSQLTMLPDV